MKKTPLALTLIALLLLCAMIFSLVGCGVDPVTDSTDAVTLNPDTEAESGNGDTDSENTDSVSENSEQIVELGPTEDLMAAIVPNSPAMLDELADRNVSVTDFAVRLFQAVEKSGENTLLSPLSVLCALAMVANGAEGETRTQMESVLGMDVGELTPYLYTYLKNLPQGEKFKVSLANSVWFTSDPRFTVNQAFLQTCGDYFGADIYKTPFNDQTLKEINDWVKEKTDGMIPQILNKLPDKTVMSLINALAFDAEWDDAYWESQVREGDFIKEDGTRQTVEFMYSSDGAYLEDERAVGFQKYYEGDKYAFVALLPKDGISLSDYVASLNGDSLQKLLANRQFVELRTSMPKFESKCDADLTEVLKTMGMPLAFDPIRADFDGLGAYSESPLFVSGVIHKTFISVGEKGTKAGAVAATIVVGGSAPPGSEPEPKVVYLDRPFLYLLIDCKNRVPIFMGTVADLAE